MCIRDRTRIRSITRQPQNNGTACPTLSETRDQSGPECAPVNCETSAWSDWGPPASQCGREYNQTRTRSITRQPQNNGTACGELVERRVVTGPTCAPVNCETSPWSMWGPPARQCGRVYNQSRTRSITRQPQNNGTACGELVERRVVTGPTCAKKTPVNCEVSEWTRWGPPALQCGRPYQQTRTRSITRQPEHGGTACGELVERRKRYGFCM